MIPRTKFVCLLALFALLGQSLSLANSDACSATQVHLAAADPKTPDSSSVNLTWVTDLDCATSVVKYAPQTSSSPAVEKTATIKQVNYPVTIPTEAQIVKFYHNVTLDMLTPDQFYTYTIADLDAGAESYTNTFKAPKETTGAYPLRFITFGDIGVCEDATTTWNEIMKGVDEHDLLLLIGDYAYDMHDKNGSVGDDFFQDMQEVAARIPALATPGNHDVAFNFFHYRQRLFMPNYQQTENMWFSYQVGGVFFVSFNTEFYFRDGYDQVRDEQYNWMKNELAVAQKNDEINWIICFSHRPLYCSANEATCNQNPEKIAMYEQLFHEYGVDIYVAGHIHYYERLWPIYDKVPQKFSNPHEYVNPKYTTYVVSGIAGNQESYTAPYAPRSYSVFTNGSIGYSQFTVKSANELTFEQIDSYTGSVIDYFTITKDEDSSMRLSGNDEARFLDRYQALPEIMYFLRKELSDPLIENDHPDVSNRVSDM